MSVSFYKKFRRTILFLVFIFFNGVSYGQLPAFNLQVTAVNESCTANGSLSFNTVNTAPNAIILYRIYKLPDTTNPIAVTNTNTLGGITAGTYRIIALQSVGNLSNTQQQDIQILSLIVPISYQIVGQRAPYCGTTGTLTVNVDQGNPVTYEIISGPMLFPAQASNVFTGLTAGEYIVRVIDSCGDGVVQTYFLPAPLPNLNVEFLQSCDLIDCNTKAVTVRVIPIDGTQIVYPLQVQLLLSAPGFPPVTYTQTLTSGSVSQQDIPFTVPYHNVAGYTAGIRIVDPCNYVKTVNGINLDVLPNLRLATEVNECDPEAIHIGVCNLLPPLMVNFLSAPAGFVPANFNPNNLGPFTTSSITYISNDTYVLPDGQYTIEVTDSCGRKAQGSTYLVKKVTDRILMPMFIGCTLSYIVRIPSRGISPATVIMTNAPAGYGHALPYDLTSTISGGFFQIKLTLPGTYTFTGINVCGDPYEVSVQVRPPDPILTAVGDVLPRCTESTGKIVVKLESAPAIATVFITQAPAGFSQPLPYNVSQYIIPTESCVIPNLPVGQYTMVVTDICGTVYPPVVANITTTLSTDPPTVQFLTGCSNGLGSIRMESANRNFVQIVITAAPATFPHPLPYDVSFNMDSGGRFFMNTLPQGTYIFYTKDICRVEQNTTIVVPGYNIIRNEVNIIANCGSFNLYMDHVETPPYYRFFWLQRFNPETNQWGHPLTGIPYTEGTIPTITNSYPVVNSSVNYNIAALGNFRILKYSLIYSNGNEAAYSCYNVIKEFEFTGELKIDSVSSVPCSNNTNDVFITANGTPPFTYRITSKDGQPFSVENGNSNIFSGLAPAVYNFEVRDLCGNIVNRELDITTLSEPAINANILCNGQNGQLSVPAISFLSYQWWKDNATSTILSTTNTLNFSPFSNATTPGVYHVRIYSASNLSCIDKTLSYTVSAIPNPNAGLDGVKTICGTTNPVDLFSVLGAPFDTNGAWQELTASGALTGNIWSPTGVSYGTYIFRYRVDSACGLFDEAVATIHFNPVPEEPVIHTEPDFCSSQGILLNVDSIPGAVYEWNGPNGFHSNDQNPTIANSTEANSGLYTVTATVDGCQSQASVTIGMHPLPEFKIAPECVNGIYTILVKPIDDSFNVQNATYAWTGPLNYTSTTNPADITGMNPGLYEVEVTNSEGCSASHSINVGTTRCNTTIPNVITPNNDNDNDAFDLSGLDVSRLEIYSRWGRLVYVQNNYTDQWHGQNMNDEELPDSTYYYIVYFKVGTEQQGWVYKFTWR